MAFRRTGEIFNPESQKKQIDNLASLYSTSVKDVNKYYKEIQDAVFQGEMSFEKGQKEVNDIFKKLDEARDQFLVGSNLTLTNFLDETQQNFKDFQNEIGPLVDENEVTKEENLFEKRRTYAEKYFKGLIKSYKNGKYEC